MLSSSMMDEVGAQGLIFVLSGPAGVGKDTVLDALAERGVRLGRVVTAVTRPPREREREGVDYYFLSRDEFEDLRRRGGLLEWAEYVASPRGTPLFSLARTLDRGDDAVLKIDVQGFRQVRERFPQAIGIFLVPPNLDELERRLRERAADAPEEIERRLDRARAELEAATEYDYRVVNDDLARAVDEVAAIVEHERKRPEPRTVCLEP